MHSCADAVRNLIFIHVALGKAVNCTNEGKADDLVFCTIRGKLGVLGRFNYFKTAIHLRLSRLNILIGLLQIVVEEIIVENYFEVGIISRIR